MHRDSLLLYAVTDSAWLAGRSLESVAELALRGGATCLQLREKHLAPDAMAALAKRVRAISAKYGAPFFVNDDLEAAIASGADGVHVGQSDAPASTARARLGAGKLLGVSAQTVEQALAAEAAGADCIGVGAVFPTSTKSDADAVSPETLRAICSAVSIPVVAIGGITLENLPLLAGTGIAGIAVVSAIFAAKDIESATRALRAAALSAFRPVRGIESLPAESIGHAVFDMDGTLLDSMPLWENASDVYCERRGIPVDAAFHHRLLEMNMQQFANCMRDEFGVDKSVDEIVSEINEQLAESYATTVVPKPGMIDLLARLKRNGARMCVCTSTDRPLVELVLDRFGMSRFFDFIVPSSEFGIGKSDPAIFRHCMERLGGTPADTMVFEDAPYAMRSAKAAGLRVCAVADESSLTHGAKISALADCQIG